MWNALRYAAMGLGALLVAGVGLYGYASHTMNQKRSQTYAISVQGPDTVPASHEAIERGRHLATIRACDDCHGDDGGGRTFIDDPMMGRFAGSNLTTSAAGVGPNYGPDDWARAVRHGVGPRGRPLVFMPSHDYDRLGNEDLAYSIAHYRDLEPVEAPAPTIDIGPMAKGLYLFGKFPTLFPVDLIEHERAFEVQPEPGSTAAYGAYLSSTCTGCHGGDLSGRPIPGAPPEWPPASDITPRSSGIGDWSRSDFVRVLNTGQTPDGRTLNADYMPWDNFQHMTKTEKTALWRYIQQLLTSDDKRELTAQ